MCARLRVFIAIAVCAIGLGRGILLAGAAPAAEPLRLDAVVAEALKQNPEIEAARHRWKAAQERAPQAAALDDPEAKIEFWNTPENLDITRTGNTIFGLSQRFPYPGKLGLKERVAVQEAEMALSLLRAKEREVAAAVKTVFFELFFAHKAIEVHHQQIDILKDFFAVANARFRAGKGAQVDVLKASVELSKLFNELPVLEQQRESAKAKLNVLLNRAPQSSLAEPLEPAGPRARRALEDLQQMAIQNRPELRTLDIEIARSQTAIALAQKQYYPDFNIMVSRFQNFGARDGFGGMVTMSLPFSFWTKPKYDAGVREAAANEDAAKATYEALKNQVLFEVKDLLVKTDATEQLITLYKTTIIPQAQQTLESARANYQTGKVEFLTLLDAERALRGH
ncbi:MAG: TolC family protein [Nitrospirae bacterium]|nr:MAG: TolC family protein [Nitrospirota bacterium]